MEDKVKVGDIYYLAGHRTGFGSYWMEVEILKIKKTQKRYNAFPTYSIKYKKIMSPYDEYFEDFQRKTYPNQKPIYYNREVWTHNETEEGFVRRLLKK